MLCTRFWMDVSRCSLETGNLLTSYRDVFCCVVWKSNIVGWLSAYLYGRSTAVKLMAIEIRGPEVIRYRQRMFGGYNPGYPGLAKTHPSWQSVSSYTESHSANKKKYTSVTRNSCLSLFLPLFLYQFLYAA